MDFYILIKRHPRFISNFKKLKMFNLWAEKKKETVFILHNHALNFKTTEKIPRVACRPSSQTRDETHYPCITHSDKIRMIQKISQGSNNKIHLSALNPDKSKMNQPARFS